MLSAAVVCLSFGLRQKNKYKSQYLTSLGDLKQAQNQLRTIIEHANVSDENDLKKIRQQIRLNRNKLKTIDLWLRYLEPIAYKK
jgi:cytochrome c peroxidase